MFELTPLTAYSLPRYGRTTPDSLKGWAAWLMRRGAGGLAALLLVAGLGVYGCDGDEHSNSSNGGDLESETQEDAENESETVCENNRYLGCVSEGAPMVIVCKDGKALELSCNDICRDKGYHEGYCHAALMPEPCDCRYAAVDGDIGE